MDFSGSDTTRVEIEAINRCEDTPASATEVRSCVSAGFIRSPWHKLDVEPPCKRIESEYFREDLIQDPFACEGVA